MNETEIHFINYEPFRFYKDTNYFHNIGAELTPDFPENNVLLKALDDITKYYRFFQESVVVNGEVKYMFILPIERMVFTCWSKLGYTIYPNSITLKFNYNKTEQCSFAKT